MKTRRHILRLTAFIGCIIAGLAAVVVTDTKPQLGLDLQGGISVVLTAKDDPSSDKLDTAVDRIRSRIDSIGVAEPEIQRLGNSVVVDLPGASNRDQALDLARRSGVLQIRPVLSSGPAPVSQTESSSSSASENVSSSSSSSSVAAEASSSSSSSSSATVENSSSVPAPTGQSLRLNPSGTGSSSSSAVSAAESSTTTSSSSIAAVTESSVPVAIPGITPPEEVESNTTGNVIVLGTDKLLQYSLGPVAIPGELVSAARANVNQQGKWEIILTFSDKGLAAFNAMASEYAAGRNRGSAFVLDGEVLSAPVFNATSFTQNDVTISNDSQPQGLGETEAKNVSRLIDEGRLPVVFEASRVEDVSPTLGKDQLRAGIFAGLVGLAIVAIYMLVMYRFLGLVVWTGIALSGAALYIAVSALGEAQGLTLTLAGVTGIIVSIGVTVDSYVVFFERLKDEMRQGRTLRSSLDGGFKKAFRTIVAADMVSILGALVIYQLSIGSVRGFAYFLAISVLLDLAVAYFFMYPAVALLSNRSKLANGKRFGMAAVLGTAGTEDDEK